MKGGLIRLPMTNKELERLLRVGILLAGLILGLAVGGFITSLRYNSEIRIDQIELKTQVAEIVEDEQVIRI